jgi:muconolactone D-isomerase
VEFLVHIRVSWPADGDPAKRAELAAGDAARSRELADEGKLIRIWRIPGKWASWSRWNAADPTELHAALSSLPLFPYFNIDVHSLATHPNDPGPR